MNTINLSEGSHAKAERILIAIEQLRSADPANMFTVAATIALLTSPAKGEREHGKAMVRDWAKVGLIS